MLQKLNERIQGVIAWVVIVLIAVTFTLFGVDYYMQSHQVGDVEVTVNGQPISKHAFEINYRRARQQRDSSHLTAADEAALKQAVLNNLITREATLQAAHSGGFEFNKEQANAAIISIPQFQQDGHFSSELYQQALSGALFTPESFQEEVQQGMLLNQQRFAFIGSSFALPAEIKRFVKLYMQTRDYEYLEIPVSSFIKEESISDKEIHDYYQTHQSEFLAPEKISIDFIRLSMQAMKTKILVSDDELKHFYDENPSNFLTPAQWQVAHILFAVPKGASVETEQHIKQKAEETYQLLQTNPSRFNEFVKTISDDKLSIGNNGILPWLVAGQSEFDQTLVSLTKPGQLSPPVKSSNGYELFKLIAYQPAAMKPLAEVSAQIKEQLQRDRAQAQYASSLEQLSELSYQSPDSLNPVAEVLKLPIEHSGLFSQQGGEVELAKNKQVVNAAFSHDVLELGNNSDPIQLNNDSVLVLRVNQRIPATQRPFSEVQHDILKKLALQKAQQQAKQLGNELLSSKKDVKQQERLMQANHLHWHAVDKATRDTDKANATINTLAFSLARVNDLDARTLANGHYVVVRLKAINNGQLKSLDKEQRESLAQQIETNYGMMDYDLYVNDLVAHATIDKH